MARTKKTTTAQGYKRHRREGGRPSGNQIVINSKTPTTPNTYDAVFTTLPTIASDDDPSVRISHVAISPKMAPNREHERCRDQQQTDHVVPLLAEDHRAEHPERGERDERWQSLQPGTTVHSGQPEAHRQDQQVDRDQHPRPSRTRHDRRGDGGHVTRLLRGTLVCCRDRGGGRTVSVDVGADGQPADQPGARPGGARHLERPVERSQPVRDPLEPGAVAAGGRIEPAAVIFHLEDQLTVTPREKHVDRARIGVLRHVLQSLEHAEVDGRLHVAVEPTHERGVHRDRDRIPSCLRPDRCLQPFVRQERRIDPSCQIAEILERLMGLGFDLHQDVRDLRRVALGELASEPRLHRQRDELLLRAVVDVALEPATSLVLRGDQAFLRGLQLVEALPQLFVQPDVAQHEPRLSGEVGDQLLVRGRHGVARRLADRERAEQLARRFDRVHPIDAWDRGDGAVRQRDRRQTIDVAGPGRDVAQLLVDHEPDVGPFGADALAQDPRHPRQHVLVGIRAADALGELRQHLVRCRALAVHDPVGEPRESCTRRLERERHHHRGHHGEERVVPAQPGADADDEPEVDQRGEERERAVDQRLADDDVQVVEAEPEDGDPDREREHQERRAPDQRGQRCVLARVAGGDDPDERDHQTEHDPLDLLALHAGRPPEPQDQRHDARAEDQREREPDHRIQVREVADRVDVERVRHGHIPRAGQRRLARTAG